MSSGSRNLRTSLLFGMGLFLALGPAGCAANKARDRWWQFWRPKKVAVANTDVILPPPPDAVPGVTTLEPTLGDSQPIGAPLGSGSLVDMPEVDPIRQPPQGMPADLVTIHFEYNSYTLTPEATAALEGNIEWAKTHAGIEILIEGHCDERGSTEYNLNLGQQRANSVREFMILHGVTPGVLHTISYGEERPLEAGQGEAEWARNRRAQFLVY